MQATFQEYSLKNEIEGPLFSYFVSPGPIVFQIYAKYFSCYPDRL